MKHFSKISPQRTALLGCVISLVFAAVYMIDRVALDPADRSGTLLASSVFAQGEVSENEVGELSELPVDDQEQNQEQETDAPTLSIFQLDSLQSLSVSLQQKQRDLDEKERELEEREKRLDDLRREIEQDLKTIEARLAQMEKIAGEADTNRQQELKTWSKIYEAMTPQQAGIVLGDMDPQFALELMSMMDAKKAGKILTEIQNEKAVLLGNALHQKHP